MAGVFRKAMVWLGLAPDEDYDDYGYGNPARAGTDLAGGTPGVGAPAPGSGVPSAFPPARGTQDVGPDPDDGVGLRPRPVGRPTGTVRPLPQRGPGAMLGREETPTVRPMRPTSARPKVVTPEAFDDAKSIADLFKAAQPVVMQLAGADRELARRLIDFSSGICYALGGGMERVSTGTYLLVPAGVEVSAEERRRLRGEA